MLLLTFFFLFVFNSVLLPFQDYFSSYETGQSVGGAKMGEPQEKTHASKTYLVSHVLSAGLEPTPQRSDDGTALLTARPWGHFVKY